MATRRVKALKDALRSVLLPLIEGDGGRLYLVSLDDDEVSLHLAGACAGCPGATTTAQEIIEPALHKVAPKLSVQVTNGWLIPEGAQRLEPNDS